MKKDFRKVLPNLLTIARVAAVPAIILSFFLDNSFSFYITFLIFSFACITDFLDGYLARMWKVQSRFGRLFDPVSDKLIVVSTLVMLIYSDKITFLSIIPAIVIILREVLISGIREFLITIKVKLPVSSLSKIKTLIQMVSISMLLSNQHNIVFLGELSLFISAIFSIYSCYQYIKSILDNIT